MIVIISFSYLKCTSRVCIVKEVEVVVVVAYPSRPSNRLEDLI